MNRFAVGAIAMSAFVSVVSASYAADPIEIKIGYLRRDGVKSMLSLIDQPTRDDGVAGARLAIEDNNTTGQFLNQRFTLEEVRLKDGEGPAAAATALADRNTMFIIADLPAEALVKAADATRDRGLMFLNAGAIDDRLREEDCRDNVIHTSPCLLYTSDAADE